MHEMRSIHAKEDGFLSFLFVPFAFLRFSSRDPHMNKINDQAHQGDGVMELSDGGSHEAVNGEDVDVFREVGISNGVH